MSHAPSAPALSSTADGVRLAVKVVPGASRSAIRGMLGERLKIAVAAPPEGGKANHAVCALLARTFGVPARDVVIAAGHGRPEKTVDLIGLPLCTATRILQEVLPP